VITRIKRDEQSFGEWLNRIEARSPKSVAIVALANKLARIAWVRTHPDLTLRHFHSYCDPGNPAMCTFSCKNFSCRKRCDELSPGLHLL